jgi:hypothetical protein
LKSFITFATHVCYANTYGSIFYTVIAQTPTWMLIGEQLTMAPISEFTPNLSIALVVHLSQKLI